MSWQKEIRMKIGYRLIGNSAANLLSRPCFDFLKDKISPEFLGREISDLGCGDGFSTQKIEKLFKAKSIKGYELNDYLVKKAQKRGLVVEKMDLEKQIPKGEMAAVWGVVHHLKDKEKFLRRIYSNFEYAVFNEPTKNIWSFLDGGEPLTDEGWGRLFSKTLGGCNILSFKDQLFVFWKKY